MGITNRGVGNTTSPEGQVKGTFEPYTNVDERRVAPGSTVGRPQDTPGGALGYFFEA